MTRQTNQSSELPWGKQPVTYRDLVVFFSIIVFACIASAFLLFDLYQSQSGTTSVVPTASQPKPTSQPAAQGSGGPGQAVFEEKCITCHTIGGGPLVGPDLDGVTARRDRDWLLEWIQRPDEVLARGDPIATQLLKEFNNVPMLNLGLSETQAADVLAYLENPGGVISPQAVAPKGDSADGEAIFTGSTRLQNGGPPCMSCHSTTGNGVLGGGTLGPDLTEVYGRYKEGLVGLLEGLPFNTMRGIFSEKPLTEGEVADLFAYFAQIGKKEEMKTENLSFVLSGLGGFAFVLLLSHFIWRKRLSGVRIPLLGDKK